MREYFNKKKMETQKRLRNQQPSACVKRAKFSSARTENIDSNALKYLLLLILSHEQYKTPAPEWLVSKEPFDGYGGLTKGEYIKSQIQHLYQRKRDKYLYHYNKRKIRMESTVAGSSRTRVIISHQHMP